MAVARRANGLDGREWLKHSISVWSIPRDRDAEHPAPFPEELAGRCIDAFTWGSGLCIGDPFCGSGTTLAAAVARGHRGVGIERYEHWARVAERRLGLLGVDATVVRGDARDRTLVEAGSLDLVVTSPPYWSVMRRRRSADGKEARPYGDHPQDLGNLEGYDGFLEAMRTVLGNVLCWLKPRAYLLLNVMDVRVKARLYPVHMDLWRIAGEVGLHTDDLVVWDRRQDYNSLRPLGYPSVFRINRVHEYVLVLQRRP